MERIIVDDIVFEPDLGSLESALMIEPGGEDGREFVRLIDEARKVAVPKFVFRQALVESVGPGRVVADGVAFSSRVLAVNLRDASRFVAFAMTCGSELEAWAADRSADPLQGYWCDAILEAALASADARFRAAMKEVLGFEKFSTMNPGSLEDWPLSEQLPLFSLLGDTRQAVGIELTESFLMLPRKSVSGILFASEERFESCQLCPRVGCPNRRLPYEPGLMERNFAVHG